MARRVSLPTISEEVQFRDLGSFRFRRSFRAKSFSHNKKRRRRTTNDETSNSCACNTFDFSNLAPSDRKRIAQLEACLEKMGLRKKSSVQKSKSFINMYPSASSVEAIPDIDPIDVLEDGFNLSASCVFDPEDDSSSADLDFSEGNDSSPTETPRRSGQENAPSMAQGSIYLEVEKGTCDKLRGAKEMLCACAS